MILFCRGQHKFFRAIPHNSKCRLRRVRCGRCQAKSADNTGCCKGERRQWRKQRTEAGAAVAECEGLLPPKHDAGTAIRHYRAFWQRRCRAAAAGAVLKPQGGNCAVLPQVSSSGSGCSAGAGATMRRNSASSITGMPSVWALVSLEPAAAPART